MNKYLNTLIGKITYKDPQESIVFIEEEIDDITDEISKSLLELKDVWGIPEIEIYAAIESRRKIIKN